METLKKLASGSLVLFYLLIGLEIIIMISPFALYFYSIYGPVLDLLHASPWTSWLTGFFLPHMARPADPFLSFMNLLSPTLFFLGLLIFLVSAGQVYWAKLRRRGVVTGGLYSLVRHPQYLGLAMASLGLLLFWPRFFILVTYISMVFLYYLLARNEERRMEEKFGEDYKEYKLKTAMFLPGSPAEKLLFWIPVGVRRRRSALLVLFILVLALGIGSGFALRAYSKAQIPIFYWKGIVVVPLVPEDKGREEEIVKVIVEDSETDGMLSEFKSMENPTYLAYVMPVDFMMQGLIADTGGIHHMLNHRTHRLPAPLFILNHVCRSERLSSAGIRRVIFCQFLSHTGERVSPQEALDIQVRRIPLFFVDVDVQRGKVIRRVMTPHHHRWGDMPMPVF